MSPDTPKIDRNELMENLNWMVNNLDTKVRLNEQNMLNEQRHIQLINKTLLSMKKDVREAISGATTVTQSVKKDIAELQVKMNQLETEVKSALKLDERKKLTHMKSTLTTLKSDMSQDEANKILQELQGLSKKPRGVK